MTPETRLETIVAVIRQRGFYAMGVADAEALEAVLELARGARRGEPLPPIESVVLALAAAGWELRPARPER